MGDIKNYVKELQQLRSLGLLDKEQDEEVDNLIKVVESLETQNNDFKTEDSDAYRLQIKFVNTSENPNPVWTKEGDSGFDLRANIDGLLKPFDRLFIPTGLFFDIPYGYDIEIKSRSGLALKHGIGVLTGTIDQNYRGEINVLLFNIGSQNFEFKKGDRIAQAIIRNRVSTEFGEMVKLNSIDDLSKTNRQSNGFGSTGTN